MKCQDIKNMLSLYMEDALDSKDKAEVDSHLNGCEGCKEELRFLQGTWDLLEEADTVEPNPDYISKFWTKLSSERPFPGKISDFLGNILKERKLVYVMSTVCVALLVFGVVNYYKQVSFEKNIASMSDDELEAIEYMELASNFDVIENLDLIEDIETVEEYDSKGI